MDAVINLTLSQHDFSELNKISEGAISKKIREIVSTIDVSTVAEHLATSKTTCRIDLDLARKLQETAETLGVTPGRVVRAAIEAHLHSIH